MSETTKFQANFKLADGTLINVYADNAQDFETQLAATQDLTTLIHSVSQSLGSAGPAKTFQRNYAPRPQVSAGAPATPARTGMRSRSPRRAAGSRQEHPVRYGRAHRRRPAP